MEDDWFELAHWWLYMMMMMDGKYDWGNNGDDV